MVSPRRPRSVTPWGRPQHRSGDSRPGAYTELLQEAGEELRGEIALSDRLSDKAEVVDPVDRIEPADSLCVERAQSELIQTVATEISVEANVCEQLLLNCAELALS